MHVPYILSVDTWDDFCENPRETLDVEAEYYSATKNYIYIRWIQEGFKGGFL